MGRSCRNQYDAFQDQSYYYDPSSSQYSYGYPSVQTAQSGNAYPTFMTPTDPYSTIDQQEQNDEIANEPPLLEELGIYPEHILQKTLSVLNPFRPSHKLRQEAAADADLAGPLVFCLAFGSLLLLTGKIHFNYIYGIGAMGCVANYGLLTLMSTAPVSFFVVVSVLGYCILPIVALSAMSILISLTGPIGTILTMLAVVWSSWSASKLYVTAFEMEHQQFLIAYPCCMLYAVFALITMF